MRKRFPIVYAYLLAYFVLGACAQEFNAESIAKLRQWSTENGALMDKVEFKYYADEDLTSLLLTKDVEPGEMIISMPAALQFPSRVSAASPVPSLIENSSIGRVSALCLYLIAERALGKKSFWAPWIETLPSTFYHALSYSDEEMEHFQESAFRELRNRKIKNVRREYDEKITPLLSLLTDAADPTRPGEPAPAVPRDAFTYDAFEWAYSVITTRSIFPGLLPERERPGEVPLILLGPGLDAVAHGGAAVRIACEPTTGRCDLAALAAMRAGDAVSVGVGLQSNLELLANRGVVLPANPNNFVLLKFQLDMGADMHASARHVMLGQLNLSSPMTYIVRGGEMPQGLLTSLRVQSLTPVEFGGFERALGGPVSLDNEWRAYRLLIASCNAILNRYPTSIADDAALLRAGPARAPRRVRAAAALRRQEKEVYESVKGWVHDAWSAILYAGATPVPPAAH